MKKEYIKPAVKAYQVQISSIIATSTTGQIPVGGSGEHRVREEFFEEECWEDFFSN